MESASPEPLILVVADGGPRSGLGHIARCSAIAAGLRAKGVGCRCVALDATEPPHSLLEWECPGSLDDLRGVAPALVLVDSYNHEPADVRVRLSAGRLAAMHDIGPLPAGAELIITTDPDLAGGRAGVIGGSRMACLGPAYWGLPRAGKAAERLQRVLVTTGGGDPGGHAVPVADAVREGAPAAAVTLVRGPQAQFESPAGIELLDCPPRLLEALRRADLVVSAAGSSLLEALAVGVPAVGLVVAENQRRKATSLAAAGATHLVDPCDRAAVAETVRRLDGAPAERAELSRRGQEAIDGYGALRVAFLLAGLLAS